MLDIIVICHLKNACASNILLCSMFRLPNAFSSILYCETFVSTMEREWHGIDRLRMDKFYLLIRLMLHQIFVLLKNNSWSKGML